MAYQIFIQDYVQPVFLAGIHDYFSDSSIVYSSSEGYDVPQENPHELFQDKGMDRISTKKWEYEITQDEIHLDTKEEEDYIPKAAEEEISIVSWEKAAEKILNEGDFSEENRKMADLPFEDFF